MTEASDRFAQALEELDAVTLELTADEAATAFDEVTLQVFWKQWPGISGWAGALWRKLNDELEHPASEFKGDETNEVGSAG